MDSWKETVFNRHADFAEESARAVEVRERAVHVAREMREGLAEIATMEKERELARNQLHRAVRLVTAKTQTHTFHYAFDPAKLVNTNAFAFGLPTGFAANGDRICKGMGTCRERFCYASAHFYENWLAADQRENNYALLLHYGFRRAEDFMVEDLDRIKARSRFRLHDSGDVFGERYLNMLRAVARRCRDKHCYLYTRNLGLRNLWTPDTLDNFTVVQSVGDGLYSNRSVDHVIYDDPKKPYAVMFPNLGYVENAVRKFDFADCTDNENAILEGAEKIALYLHGTDLSEEAKIELCRDNVPGHIRDLIDACAP